MSSMLKGIGCVLRCLIWRGLTLSDGVQHHTFHMANIYEDTAFHWKCGADPFYKMMQDLKAR